eukprot:m.97274 g.97274  ORF g.97274 m.97274 type:complete len:428 (+) comp15216_c0_seq3:85-1368(+)
MAVMALILHYVATVLRLVVAAFRAVTFGLVGFAPRPGDKTIDVTWLTTALRNAEQQDGRGAWLRASETITDIKQTPLPGGLAGCTVKLIATTSEGRTVELVYKTSWPTADARASIRRSDRQREAWFYNSSFARHPSLADSVPAVVYASGSKLLGEYVIVMEDLTKRPDARQLKPLLGNQVWGGDIPAATPAVQLDLLHNAFRLAAGMHAANWRKQSLKSNAKLKAAAWYQGRDRATWEGSMNTARAAWGASKQMHEDKLSPRLVGLIDRSLAASSWDAFQKHINDPKVPWTLCHGDFHAGNMIVTETPDTTVCLFDWSEVGLWEPMADLGQMMISDVRRSVYGGHSRDIVHRYWEGLRARGVQDYTFEQCWSDFCRAGPARWLFLFPVLASMKLPFAFVDYCQTQILDFIDAHEPRDVYEMHAVVVL